MRRLLVGSALIACMSSESVGAAAPHADHAVSAGISGQSSSWFAGTKYRHELEIASRLSFAAPIAFVTGLRAAATSDVHVPAEVFARIELVGHAGRYLEPACGPEIGLSGFSKPSDPGRGMPAGVSALEADRAGPVYVTIVATPLRIHLGDIHLVVADFHLGAALAGSVAIFRIGYFRIEYRT